ncbi:hypothetical protein CBA19CS22_37845 [Caballeronia novacaledonica]|uniref:Uncharacterized protein n=1 Tax=Caballeronia novacaledonica TaxID=1544861 RepID=A0ACB5R5T6_9BURK|nr:hypothetical protein CBA19CS22_37845 [Caballeronia novacaledonica]
MALLKPLPPKAPAAVLDYQLDWSAWLANGETISNADISADSGLIVNPSGKATSVSGGVVTFWLGGGTSGVTYGVTVTVTTTARVDSRTIQVSVGPRLLLGVSA